VRRRGGTAEQYPPDPTRLKTDRADEERHDREREEAGEVGPGMRMGDTESGEFRGHAPDNEGVAQRQGSDLEDEDELRVQRSEEELRVGTREREAGRVNVRKRVRTDRERIEVPTRREEVSLERVPVEGGASEAQIGDEEVRVPVVEDEVVVQKKPVIKEEIRVRKDVVEDTEIIEEDVRREEIDVEDDTRRHREG
ncbi:MAG: YsnF/AvaK domain-containing protein, partial [Rubrobacter sp.]